MALRQKAGLTPWLRTCGRSQGDGETISPSPLAPCDTILQFLHRFGLCVLLTVQKIEEDILCNK